MYSLTRDCWCDLLLARPICQLFFARYATDSRQAHLVTHKSTRSDPGLCVHLFKSIFSNVLHVLRCNDQSSERYAVVDCKTKHRTSAGSFVYSCNNNNNNNQICKAPECQKTSVALKLDIIYRMTDYNTKVSLNYKYIMTD